MKSRFSLDDLQLFQQVVQHSGISAAAQATGIPPATLSRRLKQLEQALGGRLLERNAHYFALTELGEHYYQRCTPLLSELQDIRQQLDAQHTRLCGRLRITAPVSMTQNWLGACFNDFMAAYPGIELDLTLSNQYENLTEQHIDAAFRIGEPRDSSWVARPVWATRVALCAAPGYLARAGTPAHPRDLHDHALLASYPMDDWRLAHNDSGEVYRLSPQARLRVNDIGVAVAAARAGLGIALVPGYFFLGADGASQGLEAVLPQWQGIRRPLYLYYRDRDVMPTRLKTFIDFVLAWVADKDLPA
ncbi:LysR family transcriptional regulator [Alcanivorax hongdengensis A-11-3]|uniref:LysR family transcriptional regulator n=1 Tax=Alcanivorax hongdengensis A-11-3 TaxID=1177179 RepID=L0WC22_9GAMM|nr:LysR family transcriptional regulator [Alcanivorax hongdengensis]EKF73647.1 LysR family transcriptional regulator [Alcanivorax hongdengensis A-11-3]